MLKKFLHYYKPYKMTLLFIIIGAFITSAMDLIFPMMVRRIIRVALPANDIKMLLTLSGVLCVLYILNYFVMYKVDYKGRTMSINMENDMRRDLFRHIQEMPFSFFDNIKTGQLISRLTGDISEIGELSFRGPHDAIVCSLTMFGTIFMLIYLNAPLGLLISFLLVFKTWHALAINRKMKSAFRENRIRSGEMTAYATEAINGMRIVKSFAQEHMEEERFMKQSGAVLNIKKKSYELLARFSSSLTLFTNLTNLVVLVSGGFMIANGYIELSDFIAYLLYVNVFMKPLYRLTVFMEMALRGQAGFNRFQEMMALEPAIMDAEDCLPCPEFKGEIEFRNIVFAYDDKKPVLNNFSLKIKKGDTVAFVGETGAGKTTVSSLLMRFYEPISGGIFIDGQDIRSYRQKDLRKQIGMVAQDVFLFSDSVKENIAYGEPSASDAKIKKAAELAAADEFIEELPEKYMTTIGERGVKLSGGQKQRLAIARVFLKNPPIVVFDEATSALDNKTEIQIQNSLERLSENRTTLVIAHRLSTVKDADMIVVMENGGVAETGSHAELMKKKGAYYKLYTAQKENDAARYK